MNINKTQLSDELARQPYRIRCTVIEDNNTWQLEDITPEQRGIHLSFISGVGLGRHGFIEFRFNEADEIVKTLIECHP